MTHEQKTTISRITSLVQLTAKEQAAVSRLVGPDGKLLPAPPAPVPDPLAHWAWYGLQPNPSMIKAPPDSIRRTAHGRLWKKLFMKVWPPSLSSDRPGPVVWR